MASTITEQPQPPASVSGRDALRGGVFVLAPDAARLVSSLAEAQIEARACVDVDEVCAAIDGGTARALLLAEEALSPPALAQLGAALHRQPAWSDLPSVVFTDVALDLTEGRRKLAQLGNVTVLERPVRLLTLASAVDAALRARRCQHQARDLLAELELNTRRRDELLAMLGHELRNPLTPILFALDLLDRDGAREACAVQQRAIIRRQALHLTRLIDDLLDVSRMTSGRIALQRAPVDFTELAGRATRSVEGPAREQGVTVAFRADGAQLQGMGDEARLAQAIVNLLNNAVKYTTEGGRVTVSVHREGDEAVIVVEDTGVGIAPEALQQVFELFHQVDRSLDRARGGMGIGLTVVKQIVELHGGTVAASSPGLDQGSRFELRLPLEARPPEARAAAPAEPPRRAPEGRHVLVVEDNPDARELLRALLEASGHRVDVAEDGSTALAVAAATRPSVVLVDIGLPGLDGYEVARRIRAELGPDALLAAVTGYGQPGDRARAFAAGFDAHLTKPVPFEAIEKLLREGRPA